MLKAIYEFVAVYPKTIRLHALTRSGKCVKATNPLFLLQLRRGGDVHSPPDVSEAEKLVAGGEREGKHRICAIELRGEAQSELGIASQSRPVATKIKIDNFFIIQNSALISLSFRLSQRSYWNSSKRQSRISDIPTTRRSTTSSDGSSSYRIFC
jgi:hypothetical protein